MAARTAKPVTKTDLDAARAAAHRGFETINAYLSGKQPVSAAKLRTAKRDVNLYTRLYAKQVNDEIKKAPKAVRDEVARLKRGEF